MIICLSGGWRRFEFEFWLGFEPRLAGRPLGLRSGSNRDELEENFKWKTWTNIYTLTEPPSSASSGSPSFTPSYSILPPLPKCSPGNISANSEQATNIEAAPLGSPARFHLIQIMFTFRALLACPIKSLHRRVLQSRPSSPNATTTIMIVYLMRAEW